MVVQLLPFPGSGHWLQDVNQYSLQTLVSKKSIEYNVKQLELQSKIVMFQNVNKHWRAHLERLFGEFIWRGHLERCLTEPQWTPNGPLTDPCLTLKRPPMDPQWTPVTLNSLFQMASPSGLSNLCLHFGTLRSQTVILTTQPLYSILFFDTNVYNES